MSDSDRNVLLSGVSCYHVIKEYFDIPEDTTGFRITINGNYPTELIFLKSTWDDKITRKFKGTSIGEVDLEFQRSIVNALGIKDIGEIYSVEVEVKSVEDIVTTTIKQYTTHGQLEDCLKLLKGESNVISVNS